MSRLNEANVLLAKEIIGRYPRARSATIPLLHLSQQQNGYVTNDAIAHVALDDVELAGALVLLKVAAIADREIVEHTHAAAIEQQPIHQVAADKAATSGNDVDGAHVFPRAAPARRGA